MSSHIIDEKLISFLYEECSTHEHEIVRSHVDQCESCRIFCKELNSIIKAAKKIETPPVSESVVQVIQKYADTQFAKQQNIKETFSGYFIPLFSQKWLHASSLAVIIIVCMLFLFQRERKDLPLDDAQFDSAITLLHDEIDEYKYEYNEGHYFSLDKDISDLEVKINTLKEEDNHLF